MREVKYKAVSADKTHGIFQRIFRLKKRLFPLIKRLADKHAYKYLPAVEEYPRGIAPALDKPYRLFKNENEEIFRSVIGIDGLFREKIYPDRGRYDADREIYELVRSDLFRKPDNYKSKGDCVKYSERDK